MLRRSVMIVSFGVALLLGAAAIAFAADYPDHPIRVIVAVPAGGGVDTVTRMVGIIGRVCHGRRSSEQERNPE